ncbi:MAG: N-acetyl-gamma-glutamyl-phosphate reductase [Deltaproteobacteria bacterium]|nr:N-acetyl-gamma-glutamyl-phosphate reductase [Deltaproteobacteria bacterium]
MINAAIIGVSGFTGIELLKILISHRYVDISYIASRTFVGKNIADVYPIFKNIFEMECREIDGEKIDRCDVVFLALPHSVSMDVARQIHKAKIIDLSADFRLKDVDTYERWYKKKHIAKDLLKEAIYGLPELYREEIKKTRIVANPGCYSTACILPIVPFIEENVIQDDIVADCKSGVSGAGKTLKEELQFSEVGENFYPYAVSGHRHAPEIEEVIKRYTHRSIKLTFVPHLVPAMRGIIATIYANTDKNIKEEEAYRILKEFYEDEPFVRIRRDVPQIKDVRGTNFCDIGAFVRDGRIVFVSAIDNLIKGASGQAVQNMNIMFNIEETEGLAPYPFYP